MWPSKKKQIVEPPATAKTIICIPGNWNDFEGFHHRLIASSGAHHMVVGNKLITGEEKTFRILMGRGG